MTMPLSTQQVHANQIAYEYHLTLIEGAKHFLATDLLTLANMRLAWQIRKPTEASRQNYNRVWRNCQSRFAFIKDTLHPRQRAKYERLMRELDARVALHLCLNDKFPKGYTGEQSQ